ncbi:1763_t:CDS:2 [Paraglomus occultum]|uniref:1763_t:CDS:1 n=1 Tax=Paraglomus occultum TaxID=144539 RepID=A0A9N8W906_9GLOM|nr:1763_t:CDS:2 [Paraglomus occultum]
MNNGFFYTDLVSSIASTSANVKPNPIADFTDTELHLLDWPPCYVHEDLLKFNDKSRPVTPPRPQNAWVLYRKNFEKCLRLQNPDGVFRVKDVSKKASLQWKEEPSEVKQYFCALSKFAQYVHRYTYPYYVYHPKRRKRENKEYRFKVIGSKEYGRREIIKEAANKRTDEGNGESAGRTETSSEECNLINENTVGVVPVENSNLPMTLP